MLDDFASDDDLDLTPPAPAKKAPAPVVPQLPPPPKGDFAKAEKYTQKLTELVKEDKVIIQHTDLKKYDLNSLQDHYRMDLGDYEVEVSHSKQPESGKDLYVLLFNNLKRVSENGNTCTNKVILAYIHLTEEQFHKFKNVADEQLEKIRRREEARRFKQAMSPIDQLLEDITQKDTPIEEEEPLMVNSSSEAGAKTDTEEPSDSKEPEVTSAPSGNPWSTPVPGRPTVN